MAGSELWEWLLDKSLPPNCLHYVNHVCRMKIGVAWKKKYAMYEENFELNLLLPLSSVKNNYFQHWNIDGKRWLGLFFHYYIKISEKKKCESTFQVCVECNFYVQKWKSRDLACVLGKKAMARRLFLVFPWNIQFIS